MDRQQLTDKELEDYVANMSDVSEDLDPFSGTDTDSDYVPSDTEDNYRIELTNSESESDNEDDLADANNEDDLDDANSNQSTDVSDDNNNDVGNAPFLQNLFE